MSNYRQGEVIILAVKTPKKKVAEYGYKPKADNVIIEGEISGHKHEVIKGKLYEKEGRIVLEADQGCMLIHPEHKPIPIQKGVYEINIQEEDVDGKHTAKVKD